MAVYDVHGKADTAKTEIDGVKIDLSNFDDVILLDDKSLNMQTVIKKIKDIIIETNTELDGTENIEV